MFICISIGLIYPLQPGGFVLSDWQVKTENGWEAFKLPYLEMLASNQQKISLRTTFPGSNLDTLVIPRIGGNAVKIYLNSKLVYQQGDFNNPTSNLWNNQLMVQLTEPLREENTLEVHIVSTVYSIGIGATPYITSFAEAARRMFLLNLVYNDFLLITSGATLIIGVLLLMLCRLRRHWWSTEFYIGLSLLLCLFYNQDAIFRITTGSLDTFLWVKKGILSSGYLASLCFIFGIEKLVYGQTKAGRWMAFLTLPAVILQCLMPDFYNMSQVNQFANFILFLNILVTIILIFRSPQKPLWMLVPALLLGLGLVQILVSIPLKIYIPLVLPYILTISTISFGINLVLDFNQLYKENLNLQHNNRIDPLTGALNRRALKDLPSDMYNFVCIIDMDNFKEINDRFGHLLGDKILVEFTRIARMNLRSSDLVVRWGGDEFLLVIANISHVQNGYQIVEQLINRIAEQYARAHPDLLLKFSYGIVEVGDSFEKSLAEADQRMYKMKSSHEKDGLNVEFSN
ncbi:MAG: GGDEF domain-containing protein [Anaerolineae bacterium]|nr:GGDEF domain-containing protein [Anaerolineae bacterium]